MKKIRILFIDSNRDIREKIEYLLKRENDFEVEVGDDAVLAISGAKEKKFDCIIIDTSKCDYNGLFFEDREGNQMDFFERNGVEAILDIKKINPKQKVIALTTNPFSEFHEYLEKITDGFLEMIFSFNELKLKIRELYREEKKKRKDKKMLSSSVFIK